MPQNFGASRRLAAEYSSTAAAYAHHWAPVIHPMALGLLAALPLASARRVLDLGCGTGALFADLSSRSPGAHLIGADRAEGMLRLAATSSACSVLVTDAEDIGLQDQSIDVAVLAFSLFHIPDPVAALSEVWRVLRVHGVIGIVAWGQDPGLPGAAIWVEELDACGASADPRDALVMGQARMNTPERLASLFRAVDWGVPDVWRQQFTHRWTAGALLALQTSCGMPSRRLATLAAAARTDCVRRARDRFATLANDELIYRTEVLYAVARRSPAREPSG